MGADDVVVKFDDLRAHEQVVIFEELLRRLCLVIVRNACDNPQVRLESTPAP